MDYKALAIAEFKEVLLQVSETCKELGIEYFIVGAIARNIWYVSNDKNPSGTKDVDLGVYIADIKQYNRLRAILSNKYNYTRSAENAFCLLTPEGKQIDLLPFGEIEKEGQVLIEGKGLININLDGFKEVFELGLDEIRIGKEIYKACSIPGMIILKLIAYDDRPDERIKDVIDINTICQYYPSIESEFIWGNHFDLYEGDLGHEEIGVIVLGREVRKLVSENEKLLRRLARILDNAINETTPFLKLMIQDPEKETIEMKRNIMKSLKKGFMHLP